MDAKRRALAVQFLRQYADDLLGSNGCNDWEFPEDWTDSERMVFVQQYHQWNGDPEEFDPGHIRLPDFAVAAFLASLLEDHA